MEVSVPVLQYSLKKMGKNAAMTVVAKAEFAQSYIAQDMTVRLFMISNTCQDQWIAIHRVGVEIDTLAIRD